MELLEGESLADRLTRGPHAGRRKPWSLGRGMLAALSALHASGVVHRDLKPSNVFLTPHGVKLLDFGLATAPAEGAHAVARDGHRADAPGSARRHSALHGAGAGARPRDRRAHRPVRGGRDPVRGARGSRRPSWARRSSRFSRPPCTSSRRRSPGARRSSPSTACSAARSPSGRPTAPRRRRRWPPSWSRSRRAGRPRRHVRRAAADAPGGAAVPPAAAGPRDRLPLLRPRRRRVRVARRAALGRDPLERRRRSLRHRVAGPQGPGRPGRRRPGADRHAAARRRPAARRRRSSWRRPPGPSSRRRRCSRPLGDVFRLQDELAQRIVESLSPSLSEREGPRRRGVPASARAYEFYLRANEVVRDWSHVAVARDLYRQCVDEDPSFAPAWANLGRCHRLLAKYYLDRPEENLARADEAFRRALELDPGLPVAHKLYAHREAEMGRARDAMVRLLGSRARPATTPRSSPGSSTPAGTAACWRPRRPRTARRDGSTRTSRRASSTPGGPGARWRGSSRRRPTPGTSSCERWRLEALGRRDEARKTLEMTPGSVLSPVFVAICRALLALLERKPGRGRGIRRPRGHALGPRGPLHVRGLSSPDRRHRARALHAHRVRRRWLHRPAGPARAPLARVASRRRLLRALIDARRGRPSTRRSAPTATPAARPCSGLSGSALSSPSRPRSLSSPSAGPSPAPTPRDRPPAPRRCGSPRAAPPARRSPRPPARREPDHTHRQRELRHDPVLLPHDHSPDVALVDEPLDLVHDLAALPPHRLPRRPLRHVRPPRSAYHHVR